MNDRERGSFYSSLPDGEYLLADIPHLKDQWLKDLEPGDSGEAAGTPEIVIASVPQPASPESLPDALMPGQDIRVIVRNGKLVGVQVGDNEPITNFPRSRDFEHKWTDN